MAKTHTVKQGECLSSIAQKYGFSNWRTIYDHAENADFRQKRPNPNLICPGDKIYIPDKDKKEETGETGQRHTFRRKSSKTLLRILLQDEEGQNFANKAYKLEIEGKTYEGTTDGSGLIEQEIPAVAEQGELTVWLDDNPPGEGCTWTLMIGHLDPVDTMTGIQARLNNLGFHCGEVDGIQGPKTTAAVKFFQEAYNLTVDGIPGPKTQAKLEEVHGC